MREIFDLIKLFFFVAFMRYGFYIAMAFMVYIFFKGMVVFDIK